MSDLAGFFTIAPNDEFYFAGTSNNDVLLYPETEQQRLHLGTKQNDPAVLVLSSNAININGSIGISGHITASSIFAYSNIGLGTSNPDYNLDVVGTTRTGNLYVQDIMVSKDSNNDAVLNFASCSNLLLSTLSNRPYPPSALDANTTILSGLDYGNGTYISSANSTYLSYFPYMAFNYSTHANSNWLGGANRYSKTTGEYTSSTSTIIDGNSVLGDWLQIQLPSAIIVKSFNIQNTSNINTGRLPKTFTLAGSTDGSTWSLVYAKINMPLWDFETERNFNTPDNTNPYTFYRIVVQNMYGTNEGGVHSVNSFLEIPELRLFGYEKDYHIKITNTGQLVLPNTLTLSNTTGSIYLNSLNANLGIDYPTPEYKLDVNGDIRAVSYYMFSDIRKKTDIQLIDHAVDKLSNISGYTFTLNGQRSAGLIAQEVITVLPEVISQDSEGYLNISYDNMIGLLVNAVKELTARVQTLEQNQSS